MDGRAEDRADQPPPHAAAGYFEFAAHHHPSCRIDLTYLTPSMPLVPPPVPAGMRFAHLPWEQVVPLVAETWGGGDQQQRRVVAMLVAALASIGGSWTTWRAAQLGTEPPATPEPTGSVAERPAMLEAARTLAEATVGDGRQRALDYPPAGLEDLQQLRLAVRQAICSAPAGTPIRHVQPWL